MSLAGHEIVVPGSTSNLGAGFDALGLALQVYLRLRVVAVGKGPAGVISWEFRGAGPDGENYIERAFREGMSGARDWPALHVEVRCDIPMKAGLGSSAAAIVAGLRLAALVRGTTGTGALLDGATRLEGHPDNVSASILGGLTVSCVDADGHVISLAAPWPDPWRLVVATPHTTLATKVARAALPSSVPLESAVHNLQRAALLVQAVRLRRADALREALRDRLHQPARTPLVPGLDRALGFTAAGLLGTFLSGAGPSIAAIVDGDDREVRSMFAALFDELQLGADIRTIPVHQPESPTA